MGSSEGDREASGVIYEGPTASDQETAAEWHADIDNNETNIRYLTVSALIPDGHYYSVESVYGRGLIRKWNEQELM